MNSSEAIHRNRETALRVNDALGVMDDDEVLSFFTADPTWHVMRKPFAGRDGIRTILDNSRRLYPGGMSREIRSVVADAERVVIQHVNRARTNAGVDYENEYVKIFEFAADGRISAVWEYLDSAYAIAAFNISADNR